MDEAEIKAYEGKMSEIYSSISGYLSSVNALAYAAGYYMKPTTLINAYSSDDEDSQQALEEAGQKASFYSSGANNLAIKYTYNMPKEQQEQLNEDNEATKSSNETVEYKNNRLVKVESSSTSSFGNKSSMKLSFNYKNSLKISLPKGWDSYLE